MPETVKPQPAEPPVTATCARCDRRLDGGDQVQAAARTFCRACHAALTRERQQTVDAMTRDIPYPAALVGALLGGVCGVVIWWGFTVVTHIAFGLVAFVIGLLVGHGTVRLAGGKRGPGLQAISVAVAVLSFVVATYLVNVHFVNAALAREGETWRIAYLPVDAMMFLRVVSIDVSIMDAIFLAIVVWEAWRIPRAPVLTLE